MDRRWPSVGDVGKWSEVEAADSSDDDGSYVADCREAATIIRKVKKDWQNKEERVLDLRRQRARAAMQERKEKLLRERALLKEESERASKEAQKKNEKRKKKEEERVNRTTTAKATVQKVKVNGAPVVLKEMLTKEKYAKGIKKELANVFFLRRSLQRQGISAPPTMVAQMATSDAVPHLPEYAKTGEPTGTWGVSGGKESKAMAEMHRLNEANREEMNPTTNRKIPAAWADEYGDRRPKPPPSRRNVDLEVDNMTLYEYNSPYYVSHMYRFPKTPATNLERPSVSPRKGAEISKSLMEGKFGKAWMEESRKSASPPHAKSARSSRSPTWSSVRDNPAWTGVASRGGADPFDDPALPESLWLSRKSLESRVQLD